MRSPSNQDNNFLLPSNSNSSNNSASTTGSDDSTTSASSNDSSNDPDDRYKPITLSNNSKQIPFNQYNININANALNNNNNLPNFIKPSISTTQISGYSSESSNDSSSSSSPILSTGFESYSISSSISSNNSTKSKLTTILSNSVKSNTKKHLFLKKHPNDLNSNEGIDIDNTIKKLIMLNTTKKISKKDKFPFHSWEIQLICSSVREIFLHQPTLLRLQAPIKIVGDLHGQFNDLLRILKLSGIPEDTNYLFLGDYIDRGKQSLETIMLLLCYKLKYPNNFFMLRGNHESANVTKMYGFYDECKRRKSTKIWKTFIDVFNCLPLAATINDKIFCVHGGISPDLINLNQINSNVIRPTDIPDNGLITDLLWSDPDSTVKDWSENDRGVSYTFSKNNVLDFCSRFKFDLIIRGHMVVEDGYEFFAKKKLVTVFSAPNYCGQFQNWGAVLAINTGLMCSFELLKPHTISKKKY